MKLGYKNPYSFRNAALEKIQQGITTLEEVQRVFPRAILQTSQTIEK